MSDINMGRIEVPILIPEKGVDYWTEADKQEVIEEATVYVTETVEPQEIVRQNNENQRITNETNRQNNETLRQTEETTRQSNELQRISNEETRINNETTRTATFQQQITRNEEAISQISSNLEEYNSNCVAKTTAYNENATEKIGQYNANATSKIAEYDAHVSEISTDIADIKAEQIAQNTNIADNISAITQLQNNVSSNTTDILSIQAEQITQNTNITANSTAIGELQSTKQDALTPGSNIQINNGVISAVVDNAFSENSENPVQNKVIYADLQEKDALIAELQEDNENLLKAMPGVPGQGSNITLEGTSKNKFKKFEIYGKTEQAQYSGKNKANTEEYTTIASSQRYIDIPTEIEAGSYILSLESWNSDGEETYSALEVRNNERALFYGEIGSNKLSLPFSISENATYVRIYSQRSYNTSVNVTTTISKLMVREASITDGTYEPYVRWNTKS